MRVTLTVTNTGLVDADEVVQAYVKLPDATVPAAAVRLAAFERLHLPAGAAATVVLELGPEERTVVRRGDATGDAVYGGRDQWLEAGRLQVFVGGGQPDFYPGHLSAVAIVTADSQITSCA